LQLCIDTYIKYAKICLSTKLWRGKKNADWKQLTTNLNQIWEEQ